MSIDPELFTEKTVSTINDAISLAKKFGNSQLVSILRAGALIHKDVDDGKELTQPYIHDLHV